MIEIKNITKRKKKIVYSVSMFFTKTFKIKNDKVMISSNNIIFSFFFTLPPL